MTFVSEQQVRFAHVDPAGIVFYPRYFEMLNAALEDYFAAVIGVDFETMHFRLRLGVPTVKLEAEFVVPSRLGDLLDFAVEVDRVGRSSAALTVTVTCNGELRLRLKPVLVCMDLATARSHPWPAEMRPAETAQAA
ncbi:acyl-CoA thioesterase [Sphingomonas sp.]|uniref:acyl-CoA thioesterase n=1 Tax=Sphingomonas sp. TaxID=28214 RepID=UPI003B3A5B59